ncbi:hypothetical protein CBR_g25828 [Chara braunii]|uniref:Uncharacterized protein n=1 Tax=Chara braunii TaxID=69332 RepID=A0A388L6G9_CHABU|nr:hypothetical protein CBR_g25828 [Chara braunii]|eukprot:GBG77896.1 hypothetical protein CBR_g25828 [Chara braunii]
MSSSPSTSIAMTPEKHMRLAKPFHPCARSLRHHDGQTWIDDATEDDFEDDPWTTVVPYLNRHLDEWNENDWKAMERFCPWASHYKFANMLEFGSLIALPDGVLHRKTLDDKGKPVRFRTSFRRRLHCEYITSSPRTWGSSQKQELVDCARHCSFLEHYPPRCPRTSPQALSYCCVRLTDDGCRFAGVLCVASLSKSRKLVDAVVLVSRNEMCADFPFLTYFKNMDEILGFIEIKVHERLTIITKGGAFPFQYERIFRIVAGQRTMFVIMVRFTDLNIFDMRIYERRGGNWMQGDFTRAYVKASEVLFALRRAVLGAGGDIEGFSFAITEFEGIWVGVVNVLVGCLATASVESISYPAQLCKLTFVCDKKCKWTWHMTLVTTNVYQSRLMQQLYHATVTAGLTFTLLDNFCVCLGMCSVHKPTFYKFMRTEPGGAEGWNAKVVRQGIKYCEFAIDTVMRRGELVTLMVDGRYDSARGAQHCTVTTMEYETRLVVGVHTLRPKIEGKTSNALEVLAVVQLLREVMDKGLKIRCVVSDDCAALGPKLRAMSIEWRKDCHHKIKNIRKHFHSMLQLKEAKKVSSPHDCVSEAQFMQFTKKRLKKALEQRFGPNVLTPAEEQLKKSDFVAVVMRKMYPYGSRFNARALETDPDSLTEYHAHEVGMWFLRAFQLCREEGGDADSLHRDIILVADHWAGDHSGCVDGREVLCEKAGGRARLPLYSRTDTVYELVLRVLDKQCSTNITPYYVEFRHTSAVETFQGTIIIYAKKSVHFEKSFCARLSITVIWWNSHCWRDPVRYVARIAAGTSIRARPGFRRHYGHEAIDCWEDRLTASVFGSAHVSDWARELLREEVCPYGAAPLPRELFVNATQWKSLMMLPQIPTMRRWGRAVFHHRAHGGRCGACM